VEAVCEDSHTPGRGTLVMVMIVADDLYWIFVGIYLALVLLPFLG